MKYTWCGYCGQPITHRHQANQRFCDSGCSIAFHAEERRQAISWWRAHKMKTRTPATEKAERGSSAA